MCSTQNISTKEALEKKLIKCGYSIPKSMSEEKLKIFLLEKRDASKAKSNDKSESKVDENLDLMRMLKSIENHLYCASQDMSNISHLVSFSSELENNENSNINLSLSDFLASAPKISKSVTSLNLSTYLLKRINEVDKIAAALTEVLRNIRFDQLNSLDEEENKHKKTNMVNRKR